MDVTIIPEILSYMTLFSGASIILSSLLWVASKFSNECATWTARLFDFVGNRAILFSFIVSATATLGSLFYSEVLNYAPCELCWYQRIFMYPQVLLFAVAMWENDRGILRYARILSLIGLPIAAFHYFIQIIKVNIISCDVVGYSAKCTETFSVHFGYITIPMMAVTAFALLILFQLASTRKEKNFPARKKR